MRLVPSTAACSSLLALLAGLTLASRATAQSASTAQPIDAEYTAKIRELTPTDPKWRFTTELGTISGVADGADAAQGPRVRPRDGRETLARGGHQPVLPRRGGGAVLARSSPLGMSDENREEFVLAVGERGDVRRLDEYRAMAARLADPRGLSAAERARPVREAKPITGCSAPSTRPRRGARRC